MSGSTGLFPVANQSMCPAFGMMVHSAITASGLGGVRSGLPTPSDLPATTDLAVTLSLAMSTENLCRERDSNPRPRAFKVNIPYYDLKLYRLSYPGVMLFWRSGRDSNPHALSGYWRFSRPLPYQLGLPLHVRVFPRRQSYCQRLSLRREAADLSSYVTPQMPEPPRSCRW